MGSFNKEIEYNNYKFNIKVDLDVEVEKCPNGKRWSKITINDLGPSNYYQQEKVENALIIRMIESLTLNAKEWVDNLTKLSGIEFLLIENGFIKQ